MCNHGIFCDPGHSSQLLLTWQCSYWSAIVSCGFPPALNPGDPPAGADNTLSAAAPRLSSSVDLLRSVLGHHTMASTSPPHTDICRVIPVPSSFPALNSICIHKLPASHPPPYLGLADKHGLNFPPLSFPHHLTISSLPSSITSLQSCATFHFSLPLSFPVHFS